MQISSPNIYILAGPNGAGKTTFAHQFLPSYVDCREFLNADLIAAGLSYDASLALSSEVFRKMDGDEVRLDHELWQKILNHPR